MPGDASLPASRLLYETRRGQAYVGDSLDGVRRFVSDGSVQLFMTSPPFALRRSKEYGNKSADEYIEWFVEFAKLFWDKLADDGSLVIDLGGSWEQGQPTRSLYQFELLITLCKHLGPKNYHLAQEFYWYNPAKMPSPAQWVTVNRIRVKDAVNVIWWLSKDPRPKACNKRVLKPYSPSMRRLLKRGTYNSERRPGEQHVSRAAWARRQDGAIPANQLSMEYQAARDPAHDELIDQADNWLEIPNTSSMSAYHRELRAAFQRLDPEERKARMKQIRAHPARFPADLPAFFIDFLTDGEHDLVVDPFAGSNVTGEAAERAGRRWSAFELYQPYLEGSLARFDAFYDDTLRWYGFDEPLLRTLRANGDVDDSTVATAPAS